MSFISLVRSPRGIKACEPRRESLKAGAENDSKMEEKGCSKILRTESEFGLVDNPERASF